jgi:hypothetical protein
MSVKPSADQNRQDLMRRATIRFVLIGFFFIGAQAVAAVPIEDYLERLDQAEGIVDELTEGDHEAPKVLNAVTIVRRLLPPQEEVVLGGQVMRVDNSWLHAAIDDVVKNVNGDIEQRRSMLIDIADRLYLLKERVYAAQSGQTVKADENRARIDRILARPDYRPDVEKESSVRKWLKRIWDAFIRFLSRILGTSKTASSPAGGGSFTGFSVLIYILIVAAAVIGIIRLIRRMRLNRDSKKEKETREILGEEIAEDVTAAELLAKATELARQGDYRTAIRRAYLALLVELEQRGKLRLHRSKTNRDYLDSLRSERELFPPFSTMTGTFERVWYGETRATEDEFNGFIVKYHETVK